MNVLDIKVIVNKTRILISCRINQDNNFGQYGSLCHICIQSWPDAD